MRIYVVGFVGVLWTANAAASSATSERPQVASFQVEEGQRALKEGRLEEALRILAPLAKATKAPPRVRFWAAEAALKLQRHGEALGHLAGLEADFAAVSDEIYGRKARCHVALGQLDQALSAWHETLLRHPTAALAQEARYSMGALWLAKGNQVAAIMAYRNALIQGPKDTRAPEARLQVARLEQAQGNWRDAKKELVHLVATAKDPVAQQAAEELQRLSLAHPDILGAPGAPSAADDEGPPSWQTVSGVRDAQRMLGQKRPEAALLALRKLLHRGSRSERATVATTLSSMLTQLGRMDEAIAVLDHFAQDMPSGTRKQEAQFRAAYLSYDAHHYAAAKKRFERFLGTYPRYKGVDEALWFSAWCGFHLQKLDGAIVDLARLRRQFPRSSLAQRAQWWQARMLRMRHRHQEAQRLIAALAQEVGYYGLLARQDLAASSPTPGRSPAAANAPAGLKELTLWNPSAITKIGADGAKVLAEQMPDDEMLAFVLAQGTQVLDWSAPAGVRVSTLIALGLQEEAAQWMGAVRGLPGVHSRDQALGRGQILYALGDYTQAMREAAPLVPLMLPDDPSPWQEMALKLTYPPAYAAEVHLAGQAHEVPELLLLSLMRQESAFNAKAASRVSAQGLMQVMPSTGRRIAQQMQLTNYQDDQLVTPQVNINFAGWYMGALLRRFQNNYPIAIGSYNAGPKMLQKWLIQAQEVPTDVFVEDMPFRETRDYVKKVLTNLEMYSRIYGSAMLTWPALAVPSANGVDF